ncbi:hypothetical protein [Streptomyces sp. NPDC054842]
MKGTSRDIPVPTDPGCLGAATFALEGALSAVGRRPPANGAAHRRGTTVFSATAGKHTVPPA